jgi:hypothetical protein
LSTSLTAKEIGVAHRTRFRQQIFIGVLGLAFGLVVLLLLAAAFLSATSWETVLVFDRNGNVRHPTVAESMRGGVIFAVLAVGVAWGGVAAVGRARRAGRSSGPPGQG